MKVNLKKMGAIVAGATILASSAAFAGLMFGSTTLVDANGAPVAKVVVGSKAAPSDGVAAALIAGKIVSEAYKSQTLTAQVSGTAACTPGNASGNATGTCTVSNKQAQLQITVPGATAAGTYTFNNLIGDWLNRRLLDREDNMDPTNANEGYAIGGSDTSDNANPFTDGTSSGSIGPTQEFMYRIGGDVYSTFADQTITDDDAGNTYVEHQDMWVAGNNRYDSDPKEVVGNVDFLAYTLKFDGPGSDQLGIPECTKADNLDFSVCKETGSQTTIDDATETHRVKVWFLGEQWIISEMNAPLDPTPATSGDGLNTENLLAHGGDVKLAKEAVAGILNQGESLPADNLKFQLDDLEAHGDTTSAIISILDANGNILKKDKVNPGETKEFNINGKDYRFHVYKVAPGYTFGAKWADVAIFSEELKLTDGQKLDSDVGHNNGWKVSLGWKNKDAQDGVVGAPDPANPENPDTLRTIVLYSDSPDQISSSGDSRLRAGDYLQVVQDPTPWQLSYKGLDLTSNDMSELKFELKTTALNIGATSGPELGAGNSRVACRVMAPYVKVTSSDSSGVFEVSRTDGGGGTISNNEFLVALNEGTRTNAVSSTETSPGDTLGSTNLAAICDVDGNGIISNQAADIATGGFQSGTIFMKESATGTNYGMRTYTTGTPQEVSFQKIGDGNNHFSPPDGGAIVFERVGTGIGGGSVVSQDLVPGDNFIGTLLASSSQVGNGAAVTFTATGVNAPDMVFGVAEKAGSDTANPFVDYYLFGVGGTGTSSVSDASFNIDNQVTGAGGTITFDSSNTKVMYGHATSQAASAANPYYCSAVAGICTGPTPAALVKTGPVDSGLELVDNGHITERGSEFRSRDKSTITFNMAEKLGHAQWVLAPTSTNTTSADTTVVTLGEGDQTTIGGVTVKVLQITEDVGACSAGTGAVSCTADMSGVSAVIMPNNAPSVTVAMPYTGTYGNLVILDSDAVGVNTLISVGGDKVNSVTADLLSGSAVDWTATPQVVREVVQGSKIVVAGKEASDTLAAAQTFISQVKHV